MSNSPDFVDLATWINESETDKQRAARKAIAYPYLYSGPISLTPVARVDLQTAMGRLREILGPFSYTQRTVK